MSAMSSPPPSHTSQELVIGLVAPIGTDLEAVCDALSDSLKRVNYSVELIRLTRLLENLASPPKIDWPKLAKSPENARYCSYMDAGNAFRRAINRGDALALLGVGAIRELRKERAAAQETTARRAYILRSLKHPDEVASLRRIYGPAFALFSVWSPPAQRVQLLAAKIAESLHEFHSRQVLPVAQELVLRDEAEAGDRFGQNVRKAFPLADFFVNARSRERLDASVNRAIELLFGNVFHTPDRDECGMFHAHAAALRSSSLQRQVGAVIATAEGDLVAIGSNEVPKPGGGQYWSGDSPDVRDFTLGYESNDLLKRRMLADVVGRLKEKSLLADDLNSAAVGDVVAQMMENGALRDAQVMNVIEFGRCVHAEMAAIVDAARRGARVNNATLYTTTFPCHECARHIVAAGIKRVVFIEPYPKSLVNELYPDSIRVESQEAETQHVFFESFVGVAPRRFCDLFSLGQFDRKDSLGKLRRWDRSLAVPRLGEYSFRTELINGLTETNDFNQFAEQLIQVGFAKRAARSTMNTDGELIQH